MDCAEIEAELIDYHFAVGGQEQRDRVRSHLRQCQACAQQYLDVKHDIDSGAAQNERPSAHARAELRREVGALFPKPAEHKPQRQPNGLSSWLRQPTPRYRAALLMAAMLAVVAGGSLLWSGRERPLPAERAPAVMAASELAPQVMPVSYSLPQRSVDTARPQALSISFY